MAGLCLQKESALGMGLSFDRGGVLDTFLLYFCAVLKASYGLTQERVGSPFPLPVRHE